MPARHYANVYRLIERRGIPMSRHAKVFVCSSVLLLSAACASDTVVTVPNDTVSRTIDAAVGQEIHITLGNVGPALYESPPEVSSSAVNYLGVEVVPPFTPAGPNQQFQFRAVRPGDVVVQFRRVLDGSVVSVVKDTIRVR
jgi:hypothetical protein